MPTIVVPDNLKSGVTKACRYDPEINPSYQQPLKAAKLKLAAQSNAIDYQHPRGLKQSLMASLLQCDWLNKAQNLLITGPCGSGKPILLVP